MSLPNACVVALPLMTPLTAAITGSRTTAGGVSSNIIPLLNVQTVCFPQCKSVFLVVFVWLGFFGLFFVFLIELAFNPTSPEVLG